MQKWKMRHGEESLLLPKSSAIPIPPPSLRPGTELGGFFPPITVSNVTQGPSYCMGWFSIADGKRVCSVCTRHLPGTSCLALSQKHTVPLEATPAGQRLNGFWPRPSPGLGRLGRAGQGGCCAASVLNKELCYSGAFHWQMKNPPEKSIYQEQLSRQGSRTGGVN